MRVKLLVLTAALLIFGCVGCAHLKTLRPVPVTTTLDKTGHVPLIRGAVPIDPYPMWRRWWAAAELCSGEVGNFDRIKWYYVPGWKFKSPATRYAVDSLGKQITWVEWGWAIGMYSRGTVEIYLAEIAIMDRGVVMHEMLHALGFRRHYRSVFVRQCGVESEDDLAGESDPVFD